MGTTGKRSGFAANRDRPQVTRANARARPAKPAPAEADLARPFAPDVLAEARKVADAYQVVVWREYGEFYGRGLELPNTMGDGPTPEACYASVRQALVVTVAYLLERGEAPPPPAREQRRTEQVNVRLTAEERLLLEAASRREGAAGLSDFVRQAALAHARM